ncbi:coiled-coil domain-containing protein 22 [Phtheirospermum japonicum]|uniref:Coiled-coil domain-containing protein 22 n=1 Tax=Phtheirospermum japonicum TaxID=374723 RepID=A0A830BDB6_9LAMI|nr:coiled-coil domain-containing protein 22 [Phtheirospermum japonicum]
MEASEEILLNTLMNSGVPIPDGISSVGELTPVTLFSICSHSLLLIDGPHNAPSFRASLPEDSMPDRVKICAYLADAFNNLGFNPDLSFHKFLYPSKEDLYKLVRFLVGKLSESPRARTAALGDSVQDDGILNEFKDIRLRNQALESRAAEPNSVLNNVEIKVEESEPMVQDSSSSECSWADHSYSSQGVESSRNNGFREQYSCQNKEEVLEKLRAAKYSELELPDEELRLFKEAAEMVLHGQHPVEFYIEELNEQLETKRHKLKELESEWDAIEQPLQEKKRKLEQSIVYHPEPSGELKRMKEIELETESILAQIKRREEELLKLSSDVEKQPTLAPRRSYIERIKEITKNSRKQDNDIQRILKDTRELQLESNTIQERLNRTYAIVDETIFRGLYSYREAKKDPVARQAYRLLTKIHESFEQVAEQILAADRSRRDTADLEAKLAIIRAGSFNMAKLQADLDAIRKENELLEQQLR